MNIKARYTFFSTLALALSGFSFSGLAWAETTNCTAITVVPYSISSPGIYCLTSDLASPDGAHAIDIAADNVTLDFNGWRIQGGGFTRTAGVYATGNNLTIKNGRLVQFSEGISARGKNITVENMNIRYVSNVGIAIAGDDVTISHNRISDLNGNYQTGTSSGAVNGILLDTYGTFSLGGGRVVDNTITQLAYRSDTYNTSYGIALSRMSNTVIEGNFIDGAPLVFNAPLLTAIYAWSSPSVIIAGNRITNMSKGIEYGYQSFGPYMNNLTTNVTTPFTGGTPVGVNQ